MDQRLRPRRTSQVCRRGEPVSRCRAAEDSTPTSRCTLPSDPRRLPGGSKHGANEISSRTRAHGAIVKIDAEAVAAWAARSLCTAVAASRSAGICPRAFGRRLRRGGRQPSRELAVDDDALRSRRPVGQEKSTAGATRSCSSCESGACRLFRKTRETSASLIPRLASKWPIGMSRRPVGQEKSTASSRGHQGWVRSARWIRPQILQQSAPIAPSRFGIWRRGQLKLTADRPPTHADRPRATGTRTCSRGVAVQDGQVLGPSTIF